ncbi:Vng6448h (plasmid) [Halobacterium salinarum NRC-1]|uniref:Vng6078h n=2 Tax=Halobacterium salinarum NRC-34001 TaxID=2886895 RepID=Q9HHE1_HALSA|nr:Vng6078h [Halobacterium salinarum NRC-1]CAP15087.1 uncharacterized protein OE_7092F [Halobacterium salinarum R1]AAG21043.1 Vng6448h [Halobacterium salinarum NRC-1]CAP15327.1 uncharacterized protein OE_6212F [Halobacterium salinarum R1]DAC79538.1 TPA_inf: uncharacterized protein VNG_7058a [Halobacterium salinarum NRC-1]
MVSGWQVIRVACILSVSVGVGLLAISISLGLTAGTAPPVLVGFGGSVCTAYLLLRKHPNIETGPLWRFSGLVFVLFILGNAVSTEGIYAPQSEQSPLAIGGVWALSLLICYTVIFKVEWTNRSPSQ